MRRLAVIRRIAGHPRVLPLTALVLRARCVRETLRFMVREGTGRRTLSIYRLRAGGMRVAIRHGTGDVVTLGEVFHERDYEPPTGAPVGIPRQIVDLGGNVGLFAMFAATRWPEASIHSFEPDDVNATVAERALRENGLQSRWTVTRAAAGTRDGHLALAGGLDALSHVVPDGTPGSKLVPVRDVLPEISRADLVKIDIEGGEWEIVCDPRFAAGAPPVTVLEYHPGGCPYPDPHVGMRNALTAAGLTIAQIWRREDGHGMLWAWRSG